MKPASGDGGITGGRHLPLCVFLLSAALWAVNGFWLAADTRPPVWDMALHQFYALNYMPGAAPEAGAYWERSGNYPPFVHWMIALCDFLFGPGHDSAALANLPATVLLLWAIAELCRELASPGAARWACFLAAVTPYTMWMSRETILDYWLSAWFALFLVALRKTRGFEARRPALLLGAVMALGMLTKWFFAAFAAAPLLWVAVRFRVWRSAERLVNLADAALIAGLGAGFWYLPNIPRLLGYFTDNMRIGALEGEPPVLSFQSLIYYFRLLVGYQVLGVLALVFILAAAAVWRKKLLRDGTFLLAALAGGWLLMTLLRTKDPRFTMPLLGLTAVVCGAWIQSWKSTWRAALARSALVIVLAVQAYAVNFGISWLPEEVVLARGYQGSLRWDWNFFLQHYFHILGPPRREDWKQEEILARMARHAQGKGGVPTLALVPDLARFNGANFQLAARLAGIAARIGRMQSAANGIRSFAGVDYVVMTERDQGMPWTTREAPELNRIIVDHPEVFRLLGVYPLPNGDGARLYYIERGRVAPL